MLGSITPLGERSRGRRWGITVTFYVAGAGVGGGVLGAGLGAMGGLLALDSGETGRLITYSLLLAGAVAGWGLDREMFGLRVPTTQRQVDQAWLGRYRGWVYGLGFGFQLGTGVATIVTTTAIYLAFLAAFLTGSWPNGLMIGATFGIARGVVQLAVAHIRDLDDFPRINQRLSEWEPIGTVVSGTALVIAAVFTALGLLTT